MTENPKGKTKQFSLLVAFDNPLVIPHVLRTYRPVIMGTSVISARPARGTWLVVFLLGRYQPDGASIVSTARHVFRFYTNHSALASGVTP